MNKALTLVELMITCALIAVLAGVGIATYSNISSQARTVAQNRDQVVLQQVMESFRMMGGNMSAVLNASPALSTTDQAAALTLALQGAASSSVRKELGQVGNLLTPNMVIVPYVADGPSRLVPNSSKTALQLANSGNGFIVVSASSISGQLSPVSTHTVSSAASAAATNITSPSTITGAKYADATVVSTASQYVWNEDQTVAGGPVSTGTPNPGSVAATPPSTATLVVAYVFDAGGPNYIYHQYRFASSPDINGKLYNNGASVPKVHIRVSRSDGAALSPSDVQIGVALGGSSAAPAVAVQGTILDYSFDASSVATVSDADAQNASPIVFALTGNVGPSSGGIANNIQPGNTALGGSVRVTASPVTLTMTYSDGSPNIVGGVHYFTLPQYISPVGAPAMGTVTITRPGGITLPAAAVSVSASLGASASVNQPVASASGSVVTFSLSLPSLLMPASWTGSPSSLVSTLKVSASGQVATADYEAISLASQVSLTTPIGATPLPLDPPSINPNATPLGIGGTIAVTPPTTANGGTFSLTNPFDGRWVNMGTNSIMTQAPSMPTIPSGTLFGTNPVSMVASTPYPSMTWIRAQ